MWPHTRSILCSTTVDLVSKAAINTFYFPDYSTKVVLNNQSVTYYDFTVKRQTFWGNTVTDCVAIKTDTLAGLYKGVFSIIQRSFNHESVQIRPRRSCLSVNCIIASTRISSVCWIHGWSCVRAIMRAHSSFVQCDGRIRLNILREYTCHIHDVVSNAGERNRTVRKSDSYHTCASYVASGRTVPQGGSVVCSMGLQV
jgi:hypothetical protein